MTGFDKSAAALPACRRLRIEFDPAPLLAEWDLALWPAAEITLAAGRKRCFLLGGVGDHAPRPRSQLAQLPAVRRLLTEELPGRLLRAHYSLLEPGSRVTVHSDGQRQHAFYNRSVRLHLPLVSNPGCVVYAAGGLYQPLPGEIWMLDNLRPHGALNHGNAARIHLIVDLEPDPRLLQLVSDPCAEEAVEDPPLMHALHAQPSRLARGLARLRRHRPLGRLHCPPAAPARVVVHIGRHRAASTWLQTRLFPRLSPWVCSDRRLASRLQATRFDPQRFRRFVLARCAGPQRPGGDPQLLLLSREALSFARRGTLLRTAENLARAWPEARIVCVLREQRDLLVSLYLWRTCKHFQTLSLAEFAQRLLASPERELLFHHPVIETYQQVLGRPRLLVLPYEQLRRTPQVFLRQLLDFIAPGQTPPSGLAPVNQTLRQTGAVRGLLAANRLVRRLSPFAPAVRQLLGPSTWSLLRRRLADFNRLRVSRLAASWRPGGALELPPEVLARDLPEIAASNARVEQLTDLDLRSWGYLSSRR